MTCDKYHDPPHYVREIIGEGVDAIQSRLRTESNYVLHDVAICTRETEVAGMVECFGWKFHPE